MNKESATTTKTMTITPEEAAHMLAHNNGRNRKISQPVVNTFADVMRAGRWHVADPIIFDSNGQIIEGQHRLAAVVKADIPVAFNVMRGVDEQYRLHYANARARTLGDKLEIYTGKAHSSRRCSILRNFVAGARPMSDRKASVTRYVNDAEYMLRIDDEFDKPISFACSLRKDRIDGIGIAFLGAVARAAAADGNQNRWGDIERFVGLVVTQAWTQPNGADSPAVSLVRWSMGSSRLKLNNDATRVACYQASAIALHAYLTGRTLRLIRSNSFIGEPFECRHDIDNGYSDMWMSEGDRKHWAYDGARRSGATEQDR